MSKSFRVNVDHINGIKKGDLVTPNTLLNGVELQDYFNLESSPWFKEELKFEFGDWIWITPQPRNKKQTEAALVYYQDSDRTYGFNFAGKWTNNFCLNFNKKVSQRATKAPRHIVNNRLVEEARRRDFFQKGKYFIPVNSSQTLPRIIYPYYDDKNQVDWEFQSGLNRLYAKDGIYNKQYPSFCSNPSIMMDGEWASIANNPFELLTVGGHEVYKVAKNAFEIGCLTLSVDQLKTVQRLADHDSINFLIDGTKKRKLGDEVDKLLKLIKSLENECIPIK